MARMLSAGAGETVSVRLAEAGRDSRGRPTAAGEPIQVPGVLVGPEYAPATTDASSLPDGLTVAAMFPRGCGLSGRLSNAEVTCSLGTFVVVGDPVEYPEGLCPTDWNLYATMRRRA